MIHVYNKGQRKRQKCMDAARQTTKTVADNGVSDSSSRQDRMMGDMEETHSQRRRTPDAEVIDVDASDDMTEDGIVDLTKRDVDKHSSGNELEQINIILRKVRGATRFMGAFL